MWWFNKKKEEVKVKKYEKFWKIFIYMKGDDITCIFNKTTEKATEDVLHEIITGLDKDKIFSIKTNPGYKVWLNPKYFVALQVRKITKEVK